MPLIPIAFALLLIVVLVLAMPFLLVQRYRLGTARRPARKWIATINLVAICFSGALFLWASAITNFWVPDAFKYSIVGLSGGILLGLLGLALTRWEPTPRALHYTPHRWLVLILTLAVAGRLLYGFWRAWHAWQTAAAGESWHTSAGVAGSLAVGGVVLGYYLAYSAGVYRLIKRHRKS